MKKKLEDMTLEELWQLFPIFLVEHRAEWADWYQEESQSLLSLLPDGLVKRISHVGSTAIPSIWAKNIVDILLEVASKEDLAGESCFRMLISAASIRATPRMALQTEFFISICAWSVIMMSFISETTCWVIQRLPRTMSR